jgi:phage-related baseplate assembly protein
LILAALLGCADRTAPSVCTALFAMIPLTVLDQGGAPVSGLTITASVVRTGQQFAVPQLGGVWAAGTYIVFDDNFRDRIRATGDSVRVAGSDGARAFSGDFFFDVPGGCHVRKVAGPDTVVAM